MSSPEERRPDLVFQILNEFEGKWERHYPERRPVEGPSGHIVPCLMAIRTVEALVFNGGWPSVYYNRAGSSVPYAARGYTEIGAPRHAELARLAIRLVAAAEEIEPEADRTSDEWLSRRLMELVGESAWDRLDDGWLEAEAVENSYALLAKYIVERGLLGP